MSKEQEAIEELKEMDSYAYQEEAEAIAEAIRALEVVEQIKRDYVSYRFGADKVDAISNTLQKAYGDISEWCGEYKKNGSIISVNSEEEARALLETNPNLTIIFPTRGTGMEE